MSEMSRSLSPAFGSGLSSSGASVSSRTDGESDTKSSGAASQWRRTDSIEARRNHDGHGNATGDSGVEDTRLPHRHDLIRLADQLQALAQELESAQTGRPAIPLDANSTYEPATGSPAPTFLRSEGSKPPAQRDVFLALARRRYETRRKRTSVFAASELFGEPAWDILLDLYIAYAEGKTVSVSSACIGSASPPTTGLRWLGVLQEAGLVEREHDSHDQRRVLVRLSQHGVERMEAYFSEVLESEYVLAR